MMVAYLTQTIEDERDNVSLEAAQALYRAAFINTRAYKRHKAQVDTNLALDGYADCIVTE